MRDLRYIVKRILIGVGIVLVLGFINSAKASALTWDDYSFISNFRIRPNGDIYALYYDSNNDYYRLRNTNTNENVYLSNASDFPYLFCWNLKTVSGNNFASAINGVEDSAGVMCIFSDKQLKYAYMPDIDSSQISQRWIVNNTTFKTKHFSASWSSGLADSDTQASSSGYPTQYYNSLYNSTYDFYYFLIRGGSSAPYNFSRNGINLSNYDLYKYDTNTLWYGANLSFIPEIQISEIESLQPTKITTNNIITGYIFRPKFSSFDTELYDYQYKFGKDSTTWLGLSSNEQQLKFNANGELYVRIKDKSSGDIIDSATFTITGLGDFNTNVDYNITFTGEYRTKNYLNNNITSQSSSTIEEYQIYVDYIPKNSILKYQYQYVLSGDSLDNNNWQNVSSSDNGSITYVATENGTLYARILDNEDNVKYSSTFTVNNIGLLAFDNNSGPVDNFFTKISNQLGFGGPIGSLINIPISLVSTILGAMTGNFNTCTDYNLGSLWGTNLVIPCVNIKQHLGNSLYNTIDLICSCCLFYMLIKMLLLAYDKFINMEHDPLGDSTILYGDRRF